MASSFPPSPAIASSSSSLYSRQMTKYHIFLSFRGEDTRLNFTSHLHRALKDKGMNVFFDEEELKRGEEISPALVQAIAVSNVSVIVLSKDYASSKSCLAELSHIMERKHNEGHIVLPIFYHVDPTDVRHYGGSFETSFDEHESNGQPQLHQWKKAFAEIGKLKGWHIKGDSSDRSEDQYIEEIVGYCIKMLDRGSKSVSEGLVGIEYQKETILRLIEQEENRVIGLWGMGGCGKTTLAEVVYNEISEKFESHLFVRNVKEKIEKQGMESLRNYLLTKTLNSETCVDTPSIGSTFTQQRLENKQMIVVLDDVNHSDQIVEMGIKLFGSGSKIIVTSRDKQELLNGGADKIYKVEMLNKNKSLQLFSRYAFQQLNPGVGFRDLSNKFVEYAQGSPLALKVLGSKLHKKPITDWESALKKLRDCDEQGISKILKSSFDGLDKLEKEIFLDIAIFFKGEPREEVEAILSCCYGGARIGINSLLDKCLIEFVCNSSRNGGWPCECITMHDMLEEMGKDIARHDVKCKRLRNPKEVDKVLRYNQGTDCVGGIKLDLTQIDNLQIHPSVFEKMYNLKYFNFHRWARSCCEKLSAVQGDSMSLAVLDELRLLRWHYYPFKSLASSSFNPKNLVVLDLSHGNMEQLWSGDVDLVNLREFDVSNCENLKKIPNLSGATNLKTFNAEWCQSLVELPCVNHCASLEKLQLYRCTNLKKFPEIPNHFLELVLSYTGIQEVPDSVEHLVRLKTLLMNSSKVKKVSSNISKLESLHHLDLSWCPITEFPEIPTSLKQLNLSFTAIRKVQCDLIEIPSPILRFQSLQVLNMLNCKELELLLELPTYIRYLKASNCQSLERVSFTDQKLYEIDPSDEDFPPYGLIYAGFLMSFANCFSLNQDSVDNIVANAMLKIGCLAERWARKNARDPKEFGCFAKILAGLGKNKAIFQKLICCFPSDLYSANKFEYQSENSWISLKISPNESGGSRFLAFSIYLVVDPTYHYIRRYKFTCEYKLSSECGSGHEKFTSQWDFFDKLEGPHVLILFSGNMITKDENYEEASFQFYLDYGEVKKCGVNVYYVDEEPSPNTQHKRPRLN